MKSPDDYAKMSVNCFTMVQTPEGPMIGVKGSDLAAVFRAAMFEARQDERHRIACNILEDCAHIDEGKREACPNCEQIVKKLEENLL